MSPKGMRMQNKKTGPTLLAGPIHISSNEKSPEITLHEE